MRYQERDFEGEQVTKKGDFMPEKQIKGEVVGGMHFRFNRPLDARILWETDNTLPGINRQIRLKGGNVMIFMTFSEDLKEIKMTFGVIDKETMQ